MQITPVSGLYTSSIGFANDAYAKLDRCVEYIIDPYKLLNKTVSFLKAIKSVVAVYVDVSSRISKAFLYLEPVKALAIPLYSRKFVKVAGRIYHANDWMTRVKGIYQEARCLKKVTSGVASILKFSVGVGLLAESTLSWVDIAGYIFLPVTILSVGVNCEITVKRALVLRDFSKHANLEKQGVLKACEYFVENRSRIRKMRIIPKDAEFDKRFDKLVDSIRTGTDLKVSEEMAARILGNVKTRMWQQLGLSATKTVFKTTSCVVTILGLASVVGALPAVYIDLVLATGSLGILAATKFLNYRSLD